MVNTLGAVNPWYKAATTFYAPLTEEPAKLWLLLVPWFARWVNRENAVRVALALGLGFGWGELWMLAEQVSRVPAYAAYPWYYFGGFISERLMVCVLHGAFTAAALVNLHRGVARFAAGVLGAIALHYVGNFPIFVASLDPGRWGKTIWQLALSGWVAAYFIGALILLGTLAYGRRGAGRFFFGRARCPECGAVYARPMWAFNFVTKRYERCPVCKNWHMTTTYREEPAPATPPPGRGE